MTAVVLGAAFSHMAAGVERADQYSQIHIRLNTICIPLPSKHAGSSRSCQRSRSTDSQGITSEPGGSRPIQTLIEEHGTHKSTVTCKFFSIKDVRGKRTFNQAIPVVTNPTRKQLLSGKPNTDRNISAYSSSEHCTGSNTVLDLNSEELYVNRGLEPQKSSVSTIKRSQWHLWGSSLGARGREAYSS